MRENEQRETDTEKGAAEALCEAEALDGSRAAGQAGPAGGHEAGAACAEEGVNPARVTGNRETGAARAAKGANPARATDGGADSARPAAGRRNAEGKRSSARSVAFVGMTVALLAVSAWVAVPLGPVPFTLQTFVLAFAVLVLRPSECFAALGAYLLLGAVGVPVFSGMRGGIGMLAGPTGGFLWGFVLGAAAALLVVRLLPPKGARSDFARGYAACLACLLVSYACGWAQLMLVAGMGPGAAFLTAIAPFIVPDLVKLGAAVAVAQAVRHAMPSLRKAAARRW